MFIKLNRRRFLKLAVVTIASAVAGLRPRPEPTEIATRIGNGSPLVLDSREIPAKSINQNLKDFLLGNNAAEVDGPFGFLVPPEMIEDLQELAKGRMRWNTTS